MKQEDEIVMESIFEIGRAQITALSVAAFAWIVNIFNSANAFSVLDWLDIAARYAAPISIICSALVSAGVLAKMGHKLYLWKKGKKHDF